MARAKRKPVNPLERWREEHGKSVAETAELLDVGYAVAWRWLRGERRPDLRFALRIEERLGIPARAWGTAA